MVNSEKLLPFLRSCDRAS